MMLLLLIVKLLLISQSSCQVAKMMQIYWLNNGGTTISRGGEDWITMTVTSTSLSGKIVCSSPAGYGLTYYPGTTRRFNSLWLPVSDYISIGLEQYNFWTPKNGISIHQNINVAQTGYYSVQMTIEQFIQGATIGLFWEGFGVSFSIDSYYRQADYYLLLQLHDQVIANDMHSLSNECKIVSEPAVVMGFFLLAFLALLI